ncbi:DUF2500 domain-containing protein [Sesbania bispinosa]|nr:DUF2500 domain-containing protein [Sesbania bispinosa]
MLINFISIVFGVSITEALDFLKAPAAPPQTSASLSLDSPARSSSSANSAMTSSVTCSLVVVIRHEGV